MKRQSTLLAILAGAGVLYLWSRTQAGQAALQSAYATAGEYVRTLTDAGRALIERHEGLSLTPYQDQGGRWTIGYGHLIKQGDPYYPVGPIREIDQAEASALLDQDTQIAQDAVNSYVTVPLNENEFNALVSFVYNIGASAFKASTLLAKLNAGDKEGAAAEFAKWNKIHTAGGEVVASTGLSARRADEAEVFLA